MAFALSSQGSILRRFAHRASTHDITGLQYGLLIEGHPYAVQLGKSCPNRHRLSGFVAASSS